ncbi:CU044_5270 family protein [Streptomyces chartreusis]|uniref:CU044_5270 family protein n=1 Tax=Streptomyces chartreusis TaxID=1969 RepID=UPI0036649E8C
MRTADTVSAPEREADLARILRSPRQVSRAAAPSRVLSRRWALTSVAVAVAAAGALVVTNILGTTAQPAYAVTPAPLAYDGGAESATDVLEKIASRVEKLREQSSAARSDEHFIQESWSLTTRVDGQQVTSAVIPEHRETWKQPDGSMKWTVRTEKPRFQSSEQRKSWEEAGAVGEEPETWSDSSGPADPADPVNQEPPADPEGMASWLRLGHETSGAGELFNSVSERNMTRSFTPGQRAALLRALKQAPGIEYRGEVEDRAGRPGAAFSVNSEYGGLPTRYSLVFDEASGDLLSYEEELTGSAGKLNVKTPAVIAYTTYLVHGQK